jgi:UDP-N-acetyl-2-amino-2-deoxyglucuronate dehydrogenase
VSVVHLAAIEKLGIELAGVATGDYRDVLDAVRPDVVHVCTPHDTHVPIAVDALERGIHVLLEKPVAHTIAAAERLVAAAKDHPGVKVGVCLQNRYNAPVRALRSMAKGIRGASATVLWHRDAAYYADRPWRGQKARSGGGLLINQALHTVDLLQWLLGDVIEVRGRAHRYVLEGIDVEDTADVLLTHTGGTRSALFATLANSVNSPVTIEVVTDEATYFLRDDLTVTYADGRVETVAADTATTGGRSYWGVSHELLIADFHRSEGPFWIDAAEGRKSLAIVSQVYANN